jgi:Protein of unknown function (DUF1638)
MGVIGILTCEILEQEFAYLLANDRDVDRICVLEDEKSDRLIKALVDLGDDRLERVSRLDYFVSDGNGRNEVLVRVLELALHSRKKILQDGLIRAAEEMGPYIDALLLGYGLCGNALEKPDELLAGAGVPIIIPWDGDHPVDDCVGLIIGGRENYYGEQCKTAGTFFMIPGWTYHWERMFEREFGNMDVETARRLFKNYERSLLITSPVMENEVMEQNIREFNKMFGFRVESRGGTLKILEGAWQSAKDVLDKQKKACSAGY